MRRWGRGAPSAWASSASAGWPAALKAYQQNPHCDVVALSSHSRTKRGAAPALHGLPEARAYTDYQDLLKDERWTSSPSARRTRCTPAGRSPRQAGKHILVEKPVALNLDGLRRVQRAVEKAGVKYQGGFELNWGGYFQSIQRMIDADFFGDIYYAECDYFSGNWPKWYPGYDWVKTRRNGAGRVARGGGHAVDAMRQFMRSDPVEVFAYAGNFTEMMEWER